MSKRTAAALDLPSDSESHKRLQLMTAAHHEKEQKHAAGAATAPTQTGGISTAATAAAVTVSPLDRLATVELQLVMNCCDPSTLLALARCSRFALAASSHPFAWRSSPIALQCDWPLELSGRLRSPKSLLRHADISVIWRLRSKAAMTAEQVNALAALPGLRGLTVQSASHLSELSGTQLSDEGAVLLFQALSERIGHGLALTTLELDAFGIDQAGVAALATFIERSRTLTTLSIVKLRRRMAPDGALASLAAALIQCRTLTHLEVSSFDLDLDAMLTLAAVIQQSPSLTTFTLKEGNCPAPCVAALIAAAAQSRSLTSLNLGNSSIGDGGAELLAAALEQNNKICTLNVAHGGLGSAGATSMARLLSSDRCALTSLNISGNWIKPAGALALADAFQVNRKLTDLRLGRSSSGRQSMTALATALQKNPHCRLRVLDLSVCDVGLTNASSLAEVVRRGSALERLELQHCALRHQQLKVLAADIVKDCRTLQHLDVSHNSFGALGAEYLAAAVATCPALTALNMSHNKIDAWGLYALMGALVHVRTLNLNSCGLTSDSGQLLAWLIEDSRALQSLDVGCNQLEAHGVAVMAAALQPSSSLRTLDLSSQSGSGIGADGMMALADALRRGWRASKLLLRGVRTTDDSGVVALATSLEELGTRCTLTTLSLVGCIRTREGALVLVRAATHTTRLRTLDLRGNHGISLSARPALIAACGSQPHFELGL